ncbi:MAG: hypothetical protein KF715_08565 [Candidatus Didemnitutus sp.]|nr:hypothetical protein [Candidatus Didemnitutus sp.]
MKRACIIIACALLAGCASAPVQLNNSDRLIQHPQFKKAAQAAPEFVSEALKTINRLEHEIESR